MGAVTVVSLVLLVIAFVALTVAAVILFVKQNRTAHDVSDVSRDVEHVAGAISEHEVAQKREVDTGRILLSDSAMLTTAAPCGVNPPGSTRELPPSDNGYARTCRPREHCIQDYGGDAHACPVNDTCNRPDPEGRGGDRQYCKQPPPVVKPPSPSKCEGFLSPLPTPPPPPPAGSRSEWMYLTDPSGSRFLKGGLAAASAWLIDGATVDEGACVSERSPGGGSVARGGSVCFGGAAGERGALNLIGRAPGPDGARRVHVWDELETEGRVMAGSYRVGKEAVAGGAGAVSMSVVQDSEDMGGFESEGLVGRSVLKLEGGGVGTEAGLFVPKGGVRTDGYVMAGGPVVSLNGMLTVGDVMTFGDTATTGTSAFVGDSVFGGAVGVMGDVLVNHKMCVGSPVCGFPKLKGESAAPLTQNTVYGTTRVEGDLSMPRGITVTNNDPGPMIEKKYGVGNGDRYGVGQFQNGAMRMYTARQYGPATASLSVAEGDGRFTDVVTVDHAQGGGETATINGKLVVKRGNGDWNWVRVDGNHGDNVQLGSDGVNRGIWAEGQRDFSVYNQGNRGLTVKQDGTVDMSKNGFASVKGFMAPGSLTIGDISNDFGGSTNWNNNTAGLMMEAKDNTEIAVHDSGTRLASLMQYQGGPNEITVGRDMGWGPAASVKIAGPLNINEGNSDGSKRGINLWSKNDKRFGMWMGETSQNGGKNLNGGPVADGDISNHSVRFSTGNWGGHGFVFQNSDGRNLMSIKGDDGRTNVYGPLNVKGDNAKICIGNTCLSEAALKVMLAAPLVAPPAAPLVAPLARPLVAPLARPLVAPLARPLVAPSR